MKGLLKVIPFLSLLFLFSCFNQNRVSQFSKEQTRSLALEETQAMTWDDSGAKVLDLNGLLKSDEFDYDALFAEIKCIPLETNEQSLLARIRKIVVSDKYIYIMDDFMKGGLVIFGMDGKFIKRISNGNGPGEINRLYDIAYDYWNDELVAYEHSFLTFYTPEGKYKESKRLPLGFYNFSVLPDGFLFFSLYQGNLHLKDQNEKALFIANKDFRIRQSALDAENYSFTYSNPCGYLNSNEEFVSIVQNYSDNIYRYDVRKKALTVPFKLDYNRYKISIQVLKQNRDSFFKYLSENDKYYFLGEYFENTNHSFISLRNDFRNVQPIFFYDKASGHLAGGRIGRFDEEHFYPVSVPQGAYKDYFIYFSYYRENAARVFTSDEVLPNVEKMKIVGQKPDDNPVVVFFKLKSF